jgi:hypothetical protein
MKEHKDWGLLRCKAQVDREGRAGCLRCKAWVEMGKEGEAVCDAKPGWRWEGVERLFAMQSLGGDGKVGGGYLQCKAWV